MISELFVNEIRLKSHAGSEDYVFQLPAVRALEKSKSLKLRKPVTFLSGENGSGKSTLLEAAAVACGFNAEGGGRNFAFSTYRSHSALCDFLQIIRGPYRPKDGYFLRAESFYNVASNIEELDAIPGAGSSIKNFYGGVSLHEKSHGESFLALILNRFFGNGLYFLDEPEAALSTAHQLTLLARIHELVGQKSQFVIATHSPILLAYPGADILVLDGGNIRLTPYEQTDPYLITRRFLNNRETMLQELFSEKSH